MNSRISEHVDKVFVGVAHTKEAADIKEELLANLNDKYNDLIGRGTDEDEAFRNVISGIGDIQGLLGEDEIKIVRNLTSNRQKSGALVAAGVMVCILAICATILFGEILNFPNMAALSFLSLVAIGVGLFIFASSIAPKKYKKGDDTFVETYKEKVTGHSKDHRLRGAVSSTLWLIIVIVYLGVSFVTHAWWITWLIFIVGAMVNNIIMFLMGDPGKGRGLLISTLWLGAVIGFFLIGFWLHAWAWAWLIFLVAAALQQLIRLIRIATED
ncbi:hypothetical protein FACS1894217_07610 [Clostridia bacterium]|nr:hypothetical protein FACS1894217_07610 [Clostridia bacterium]